MRYGMNGFVRDGEVQFGEWNGIKTSWCFGTVLFDGRALFTPHCIPRSQIGQPHEMVLRVGGTTYYPTRHGYVRLD